MPTGMMAPIVTPTGPVIGRPKRDRRKQAAKRKHARSCR